MISLTMLNIRWSHKRGKEVILLGKQDIMTEL